jgi:beta-aspartyl-dipeptidase (metallo-type)
MSAASQLTIINNANLFSPDPQGLRSLLVGGGKILAISESSIQLPDNLGVEVIDLGGQKLLPGYIDSHAHLTGGGGEAGFSTQVPPVPISQFTDAGVTTVVGLLGTDDTTRSTESLLARVYGLREEGLSAYCWTGGYHLPLTTLTGSAKTDIVYLEPVIGVGEFAISDHRSSQPTFEEVIRLASETHVAGLITGKAGVLHFHLGDGDRKLDLIKRAITETELPARTFNPTHINRNKPLFDEACELLALGIHADITAFPKSDDEPGYSAAQAVKLAVERNLPLNQLTISSDGGGCLPCFNCQGELTSMDFGKAATLHETVLDILAEGLELTTILPMLTANVADLLRMKDKGRLAVGKDADMIVLDENNNISCVMAQGRWHKKQHEQLVKGTFE